MHLLTSKKNKYSVSFRICNFTELPNNFRSSARYVRCFLLAWMRSKLINVRSLSCQLSRYVAVWTKTSYNINKHLFAFPTSSTARNTRIILSPASFFSASSVQPRFCNSWNRFGYFETSSKPIGTLNDKQAKNSCIIHWLTKVEWGFCICACVRVRAYGWVQVSVTGCEKIMFTKSKLSSRDAEPPYNTNIFYLL